MNTYTARCLNCGKGYTANTQSAICPHMALDDPREIELEQKRAKKKARREADPMCVCDHLASKHEDSGAKFPNGDPVLKCTVEFCACGPGCIHEGFVDKQHENRKGADS